MMAGLRHWIAVRLRARRIARLRAERRRARARRLIVVGGAVTATVRGRAGPAARG